MANPNDALELAEDSRQTEWKAESVVAELFKGNFKWEHLHPFPQQDPDDKKKGDPHLATLEEVLKKNIDPDAVDILQEVPDDALNALAEKGFFGIKIPEKYGGLGLSIQNYLRAMAVTASWCSSTAVWLSAHQSIGVPQPLMLFGTDDQKEKFLPRLAKGAISAFALTEPDVGSDPARMSTTATPTEDGKHYILSGDKLYITNGPKAELLVVMAVTPPKMVRGKEKKQITAFIVETNSPGFEVVHKCSFMGIRGIANGLLRFDKVKVPAENIIGKPGEGLKIALVTLNTGRLTIPAISAAAGKLCLHWVQDWSKERVQWGRPIGEHQAVQSKISNMVAGTFAMEAMSNFTGALADDHRSEIRLEAAMAKYFGSEQSWEIADQALQIRGGRGFETSTSLGARGESPYPIERLFRDLRINRIIEGTSEIMRLFIAREAMDVHLKFIFPLLNPKTPFSKKIPALLGAIKFYMFWYPKMWLPARTSAKVKYLSGTNKSHLRYIGRTSRKMARKLFHTMARYQQKLEHEQLLLACFVDIGTDLFAMATTLAYTEQQLQTGKDAQALQQNADMFCRQARRRIAGNFKTLQCNTHKLQRNVSRSFLDNKLDWLLDGIIR